KAKNDESTKCHFCPNNCSRTFIDAFRPDGTTSRYISGFSCEKGMVESKEAMLEGVELRKKLMKTHPNLVTYEARKPYQTANGTAKMPEAGTLIEDTHTKRDFWGSMKREEFTRGFERSSAEVAEKRRRWRVGMPRVLNMYSTGPFFRTYFEVLGVD